MCSNKTSSQPCGVNGVNYIHCTGSLVPVVLKQAREKNVDVVRNWDLGVTSPLKVLQNAQH